MKGYPVLDTEADIIQILIRAEGMIGDPQIEPRPARNLWFWLIWKEFKARTRGFSYRCLAPGAVKPIETQEISLHPSMDVRPIDEGAASWLNS